MLKDARSPRALAWATLTLALLAIGLWNLDGPPMWWDEGWTLSVARSWAEDGRYARLRDGAPAAPGLEAAFTVTLPVGLSMRLLGVGIWQGRLFGVICAVAAILLLAALACRLYGRKIAIAAVLAALLLSLHPQLHPLLQGRQVLAEMPMLAYLLAGYLCLWWALAGRRLAVAPAAALFGLAWLTKGQTAPFLVVSLAAPLLAALTHRRWGAAATCATALVGAYAVARVLHMVAYGLLIDRSLPADPVDGLLGMVAVVLTPFNRVYALRSLLLFGLPTLLALLWGLRALWRERAEASAAAPGWYLRLALLCFIGSWLAWFVALSVGVPRYMSPPVMVGSIFVAALLHDISGGFAIGQSALTDLLTLRRPSRAGGLALLGLLLTITALTITGIGLARYYPQQDHSAQRVATMLNALPAGTRVETYESELHALLDQPYTFPPDQLHVQLGLRSLRVDESAPVVYDALAKDPSHLVVGRFARENGLYQPIIESGAFRLLERDGLYEVYERAR
jgi:4-amino-4-deoxy-L-arabinose transferase-like glycosyltransferase